MRKLLAALTATLLVGGLVAALEHPEAKARTAAAAAAPPPVLATGAAPEVAAGTTADASPPVTGAATAALAAAPQRPASPAPRAFPTATPDRFHVERAAPVVDDRLQARLAKARPDEVLAVLVHAADAGAARRAAEQRGLAVATTFDKIGVAVATGPAAAVAALTTARGVSYLEADEQLDHLMATSNTATRGDEARKGFSVSYDEPQPPIAGSSKRVCTTRRNSRGRIVRDRRGRAMQRCRTQTTPPRPQPPVRRTLTSAGVDGSGVTIAVIDSGVDGTHPMFQQGGKSKVVRNLKFVGIAQCATTLTSCEGKHGDVDDRMFVAASDTDTISGGGHGTHVAGTAAGVDVTTRDGQKIHGAAPGAKVVSLSVGNVVSVIGANAALNWVLEHHKNPCGDGSCPPIKVTNNSYGAVGGGDFRPESATTKLQRALVVEGVVTVWANGNGDATNVGGDGSDNRSNPPGQDPTPGIISVANYDDADSANRDNLLNSSSSRGEQGRVQTYPDLSAPGTDITSACRVTLPICRDLAGDPDYGTISGTSMAAPHVAGIVAQLFQANPALTPADVEDALEDTARPFAFGGSYEPDVTNDGMTSFDKGHGLVDVVGAVARVRGFHVFPAGTSPCTPDGPVSVDPEGDAREFATSGQTPLPNEPALDVLSVSAGWDPAAAILQLRVKVKDLGERPLTNGSDGESFNVFLTHVGTEFRVNANRSGTGTQSFTVTGAPAGVPRPTGSFDAANDVVTINVPAAALATPKIAAPTDGTALLNLYAWSRRVAGPLAPVVDRTGGRCPFTLGLGAVAPPEGTTTGPDAPPKPVYEPPASQATLTPGGPAHTWSAGPFTGVDVDGACRPNAVRVGPARCDVRGLTLDVPADGATFVVTVTPSSPAADFDLFVYDPTGKLIAKSAGAPIVDEPTSTERVEVRVERAGVYRIEVNPYTTAGHSFKGEAKLR